MARQRHATPTECFEFTWRRREKGPGFHWEQDRDGRWLLVGPPDESLAPYEPLVQETGLFLTFANLDGKKDAFLRFADTYGRLGTYHFFDSMHGEPLDEWQNHYRWMRFLAELRTECIEERPELDRYVSWKGDEVIFRFPKVGTTSTETWRHRGQRGLRPLSKTGLPLFNPGDLVGPARWFLGYAIDHWLQELQGYKKPIAPRMVWSETDRQPQLVFGPSSLLGAMVCQFAVALHGGWPFQECAFCQKFFRLAPGINRANKQTCSLTCKQYLHNARVKRAGQLHADGWSIRQIVKELQVKPQGKKTSDEVVKNWIDRV